MSKPELILEILSVSRIQSLKDILGMNLDQHEVMFLLGTRNVWAPERLIPFVGAMHLGFSTDEIAFMMKELRFELHWIGPELSFMPLIHRYTADKDSDSYDYVNFLQEMVDAYYRAHDRTQTCAERIGQWMGLSPKFTLAALSVDLPGAQPATVLERLRDHSAPEIAWQVFGGRLQALGDISDWVMDFSHFPGRSPELFLSCSGALDSDVIRGRFSRSNIWTSLLLGCSYESVAAIQQYFFDDKSPVDLETRKEILFSLDFSSLPESLNLYSPNELLENLIDKTHGTDMESFLNEEALLLRLICYSPRVFAMLLKEPERLDKMFPRHEHLSKKAGDLFANPEGLLENLMVSQMRCAPKALPLNQFLLWKSICTMQGVDHAIHPQTAKRYLRYALEQFQDYKLAPQGVIDDLDVLYEDINSSFRALIRVLEPHLDYQQLAKLDEARREDLVLWGLDVHKLAIEREEVLAKRFELDLGL